MIHQKYSTMAKIRRHINRRLRLKGIPIPETPQTEEGTEFLYKYYLFLLQNDFNPLYAISCPYTPAQLQEMAEREGWD